MCFATTIVLLSIFILIVYVYSQLNRSNHTEKLPGIKPQWVFGNLYNTGIVSGRVTLPEAIAELKEKYGDVFSFWFGPYYSIVLSRIDHVQHVLADRHTYDIAETTTRTFGILFPRGLLALRGDEWKRHARFILPMLKRAKVLPYLDTMIACTDRFIDEKLARQNGEIHTDLVEQSQRLLLDIIGFIAFDYDLDSLSSHDGYDLPHAFNDFVRLGNQFILKNGIPFWLGKLILRMSSKYQQALRTMKHYVLNVISEEQARQQEENSTTKPKNLVSSLVAAIKKESSERGTSLTPNEVFDEVSLLILAGFETTSTALSWFIFYMSKYPEVQEKMKAELKEHNLTPDMTLTKEMLDSMVYLDCLVKEILRFSPIAPVVPRQATCDDIIDGIEVKKGDKIVLAIQNLHRDPRYWKIDPSKFIPERFLHEDKHPPHCAYMPFGGGHRACAGQDLALLELKVLVARLMQRVTFIDPGNEANNSGGMIQRITCYPKHVAVRVHLD
ncbi:unnamed protein product [Rotaria magnacalcarata]|uniref:Cytochrome P450 n=5 Tax=Rotaria magnacalcarata TaxID=392030 RepID=A0A819W078_9BILA|nr:unnamed protein product [Rotaria magnacalcarata]CAF4117107.1 unnamed protein product [Rotaria magnacalcarata]